jgi:hypothetical protein
MYLPIAICAVVIVQLTNAMPQLPSITTPALLPRAIQTFGWYSYGELDGNTACKYHFQASLLAI